MAQFVYLLQARYNFLHPFTRDIRYSKLQLYDDYELVSCIRLHAVDGSEIPNHRLAYIKPCK